jgi:hypothetical protein
MNQVEIDALLHRADLWEHAQIPSENPTRLIASLAAALRALADEVARLKDERNLAQTSGVDHANYWMASAMDEKNRAERAEAECDAMRKAMVKVRAHTSYIPGAEYDFIVGLLASVERIANAALACERDFADAIRVLLEE